MITCIYCGRRAPLLTDEHIIPHGLGGDQVLTNASCESCSALTSRSEARVLRQSYGLREVRSFLGIGTRRRQEKPKSAEITLDTEAGERRENVPLEKHPLLLHMLLFEPPTFLTGRSNAEGIRMMGAHHYSLGPNPGNLLESVGAKSIKGRYRGYDHDFGKFLAKIAWASWVKEFGTDHLDDQFLPRVITGEERSVGRYVGSLDYAMPAFRSNHLHWVDYELTRRSGRWLAAVRVWLFTQLEPSPTYIACVGTAAEITGRGAPSTGWTPFGMGGIGQALQDRIPKYVSTTVLGKRKGARASPIVTELEALGLSPDS